MWEVAVTKEFTGEMAVTEEFAWKIWLSLRRVRYGCP
jgi:hypothetical protein